MPIASTNEIHIKYVLDTGQLQAATAAMSQITAEERKLLADLKKLQAQLAATGAAGASAGNNAAGGFLKLDATLKSLIPTLSTLFVIEKAKEFAQYALNLTMQFEQMGRTLAFVSGSTGKAAEQFSYLTSVANNLGLDVKALIDGYKGFAAAASFAGVSQQEINKQMLAFTKAASALAMSADDTKLMFNALAQMYSKNKISAEELRQQLGERLPGSMELLAKSLKIPVKNLDELMKKGELITKDVMPAFAKEVELAFGTAANNTNTLTASWNRMVSEIQLAIVKLMSGGIGDMIKWFFNRVAAMADFVKWFNQNSYEADLDYFNKRKVEVEKNVLFEIEAYQKMAKEKQGIDLNTVEAAQAILADKQRGEEAYFKWQAQFLKEQAIKAGEISQGGTRYTSQSQGLLAFLSDVKKFGRKASDATKAATNTILSPLEVLSKGFTNVFVGNLAASANSFNRETQNMIDLAKARYDELKRLAEEAKAKIAEDNAKEEDEAGKRLNTAYKKELEALELQEKIRRLYAEARIKDEHRESQELIRISIEFNKKKAAVDEKYFGLPLFYQAESYKKLREEAKNNFDLRIAENTLFNVQLNENEIKYREQSFNDAKAIYEKTYDARVKQSQKIKDLNKSQFDKELEASANTYDELIFDAQQGLKKINENVGLYGNIKKQLVSQQEAEINFLIQSKSNDRVEITRRNNLKLAEEHLQLLKKIDEMYEKEFNDERARLETIAGLHSTDLETRLLAEKNFVRSRNADEQELALLEKKHAEQRVELQLAELQRQYNLSKEFEYVNEEDRKTEQEKILADMRLLEEQKTEISQDYADQRKEYEIQVLQQSAELASQIYGGIIDLRNQQLDKELDLLQKKSAEEIRLADGNKQKILAIEQRTRDRERSIKIEQFKAQQTAAVADVVFRTAPIIAQYAAGLLTAPLAIIASAAAAFQIGAILAQPVPEFRKGTRGIPHKGGPAIVGEEGVEKVVTESGRVYYTPPTATLLDLPKGAQVIPNNLLDKQEIYWASSNLKGGTANAKSNKIELKLDEIGGILKGLPIHQINMNERGFEKFVRTERRTTKILNNRFPQKNS